MKNIFNWNIVEFNNGKYGCRKFTLKGWLYLLNRDYVGFSILTPWTQQGLTFDTKEEIPEKVQKVKDYLATTIRVV